MAAPTFPDILIDFPRLLRTSDAQQLFSDCPVTLVSENSNAVPEHRGGLYAFFGPYHSPLASRSAMRSRCHCAISRPLHATMRGESLICAGNKPFSISFRSA